MYSLNWNEDGWAGTLLFNTKAEKKAAVKRFKASTKTEAIISPSSIKTLEQNVEIASLPPNPDQEILKEVATIRCYFKSEEYLSDEASKQLDEVLYSEVQNPVLDNEYKYRLTHVDDQYVYALWRAYKKHASNFLSWGTRLPLKLFTNPLLGEMTWDLVSINTLSLERIEEHQIEGALKIQTFFGKNCKKFWLALVKRASNENWVHDFGLELDEGRGDNQLVSLLIKWVSTTSITIGEARKIVKFWGSLDSSQKKLASRSYKRLLELTFVKSYDDSVVGYEEFGYEAGKWGYSKSDFEDALFYYKEGLNVPEMFDSKACFENSGYVGKFLPRADVRVGFFGEYTNCCQHYLGAGSDCAISSVKDEHSQLFVIENSRGEILCGSWVWMNNRSQVCFDNIEAKGMTATQKVVAEAIYREVAKWIHSKTGEEVSTGLGLTDLELKGASVKCKLPHWYIDSFGSQAYTDAHNQISLLTQGDVSNYDPGDDDDDDDDDDDEDGGENCREDESYCLIPRGISLKYYNSGEDVLLAVFVATADPIYMTATAVELPYIFKEKKVGQEEQVEVCTSYPEAGFYVAEDIFETREIWVKNSFVKMSILTVKVPSGLSTVWAEAIDI